MKLAACFLTLLPGFAVAASWTSPGFSAFSEQGTGTFVSHAQLPKGTRPLTLNFDQQCWQPADAIKLNQMLSCNLVATRRLNGDCSGTANIRCK